MPEKYGIEQQPRLARERLLQPLSTQLLAERRRAPVLPDDGVVDRLAALLLPEKDRLTLVGDAYRGDIARFEAAFPERGLTVSRTVSQISSASCSTHPDCG